MPTESTWVYPKPKDWDEFENIVWDLFRREWQDPDAQRYGRSGQEQHGVDIYGRPIEMGGAYVGVQCKRYEDGKLTEKIIRGEIKKIEKGIEKGLLPFKAAKLIIATTANTDKKLQDVVIRINQERETRGGFPVGMRFWEDLSDMLADVRNGDLRRKHYPTLTQRLTTSDIEQLQIKELPELRSIFSKGESAHIGIGEIAEQLQEWKDVHRAIQKLFVSILPLEALINAVGPELGDVSVYDVENYWFEHCNRKIMSLIKVIRNLKVISSSTIDDLISIIEAEPNIYSQIRQLDWANLQSIQNLKISFIDIKATLDEALELADVQIIDLAEGFKNKST